MLTNNAYPTVDRAGLQEECQHLLPLAAEKSFYQSSNLKETELCGTCSHVNIFHKNRDISILTMKKKQQG
jgi:hypothetical protein